MSPFDKLISASNVHFEWVDLLRNAFDEMDKAYLDELLHSSSWLPGIDLLFNAFKRDRRHVRYVLIGESPYPRQTSANGIAFYDAAVTDLWCATGLSKSVNRATSMRNIIKTALFSEGYIQPDSEGKISQASIAKLDKSRLVQTMPELFENLQVSGFLMLNATPVLYPDRKPVQEAKFWQGFLLSLLKQLGEMADQPMLTCRIKKALAKLRFITGLSSYRWEWMLIVGLSSKRCSSRNRDNVATSSTLPAPKPTTRVPCFHTIT
jgi:uracil-DNA glycosylase